MKFKVGDYVERVGPVYDGIGLRPEAYGLGKILKVIEVKGYYVLLDSSGNQYSAWEDHLVISPINNSPLIQALY